MRARQDREANRIGILLERGGDNLFGGLPQARIDHFHAGVAQRAGDHLGSTVVPVEPRFSDNYAYFLGHLRAGSWQLAAGSKKERRRSCPLPAARYQLSS